MQGNAGWSNRQFVSGLLKVNSYLQRSIWMIFLSPVSCAAISDGCLQWSNDANWVLHCTNIVLCVVPASSSAAKQQTLQLINTCSILRLLFRPFMSCKENAKILMFSWEDFTRCGSCKLLHRSQIAHPQRSPADNLAWPEAKHRVCVCVCVCLVDCARSRM